MGSHMQYDL